MSGSVSASDAMQVLYDATVSIVQERRLDFPDIKKAWQTYLKTHYLMAYAMENDSLTRQQADADATWLASWVREADDADLQQAIETALLSDDKGDLMPQQRTPESYRFTFDMLIEQAWRMTYIVAYGEQVDKDVFDQRMQEVAAALSTLSDEEKAEVQDDYLELLQQAANARAVLHGLREPEIWVEGVIGLEDEDIFTDKEILGTFAWNLWMDVLTFIRGEYHGQSGCDRERFAALMDLERYLSEGYLLYGELGHGRIHCSPYEAAADPIGTRDRLIAEGKIPDSSLPDWYEEFLKLGWNEMPSESTVNGFAESMKGVASDD